MLIVKIIDKATEVKISEREWGQPKQPTEGHVPPYSHLYVASVEEASPWVRSDKTDWSSEARSNRVT